MSPTSSPSAEPRTWSKPLQVVGAFGLGIIGALLLFRLFPASFGGRPQPLERERIILVPVDLNAASKGELLQLPGVGDKLADRILAKREFERVDDLRGVKGIGSRKLDGIRPHAGVEPREEFVKAAPTESMKTVRGKKELPHGVLLDVNRATMEELQLLDGIGPVTAAKIIEERARLPFRSPEELIRVKGIGPKTMDKIRAHITVGSADM